MAPISETNFMLVHMHPPICVSNPHMHVLHLPSRCDALAVTYTHTPHRLLCVHSPGNNLGAEGAAALAPALAQLKGLTELWLNGECAIGLCPL